MTLGVSQSGTKVSEARPVQRCCVFLCSLLDGTPEAPLAEFSSGSINCLEAEDADSAHLFAYVSAQQCSRNL